MRVPREHSRDRRARTSPLNRGRQSGRVLAAAVLATVALQGVFVPVSQASRNVNAEAILNKPLNPRRDCPWVKESLRHKASPSALAGEVLSKMTLFEKAGFVVLQSGDGIQDFNNGVPSLCIPPLTLTDGPDGLAGQISGVTRLPAAIGVGATFDPTIAFNDGQVEGSEARIKGVDVVQAPDLNLARAPLSGRLFESFGEDPYLTGVMGASTIEGIQSQGVMALAKHFSAYTQETARTHLDQIVPQRALVELYDAPFQVAVTQAHVAALMCSVGMVNGVNDCADPDLYRALASWGFTGFVRSDNRAAPDAAQAFKVGLDIVKPKTASGVAQLVHSGALPVGSLNRAVRAILIEMFAYGLIAHPRHPHVNRVATSYGHDLEALDAAQESVVLLKNADGALPLLRSTRSVAVIGTDATSQSVNTGGGSSFVRAESVVAPLAALRQSLGTHVIVRYAPGEPLSPAFTRFSDSNVVTAKPVSLERRIRAQHQFARKPTSSGPNHLMTPSIETASVPQSGAGWSKWHTELRAQKTGTYQLTLQEIGDTWLYLNGHQILSSAGLHAPSELATTVRLRAGVRYRLSAKWFAVPNHSSPSFAIVNVSGQIDAAVALARRSKVAIIFAGDFTSEGSDRSNLNLPGDQDALISAVAAANPRTIVVLNTGGAVLMPWLSKVAAVLEAWYPGSEDGTAVAAVLTGAVDPSGRLPITFPASLAAQPTSSPASFPGVNAEVSYGTSTSALDVGYRWYQAHDVTPLFPFGYGLDYTTFSLSQPSLSSTTTGYVLHVRVTNTGSRAGADVVQVYLHDPPVTGEPPDQLRDFARVMLAPSSSRDVALAIPSSALQVFLHGTMVTVPGTYRFDVGQASNELPLHLAFNVS
ncbi:MAG: glycoside hydrolase family 3 C-terminal domain-containing protein [Acidimicrobiales bacterium]|jgi:beta-glucosidase